MKNDEKWGGRIRSESSFKDFKDFIGSNQLVDIEYQETIGHGAINGALELLLKKDLIRACAV